MSKIEIQISASRPIFIEADADAFGQVFAGMSSDEQVAVFRAIVEHMKPHRLQWDYIAIELEQDHNRAVREELRSVLFSAEKESVEDLRAEVERHSNAASASRLYASQAKEALIECEEYFDDRADADCDQDGYIPNKEMRLLNTVREALKKAGA